MKAHKGFLEEIKEKTKAYPQNSHTHPLHPQEYAQALTQQIARELGATLEALAREQRYDEVLNLSKQIRNTLHDSLTTREEHREFDSPLNYIHYRFDEEKTPHYPGINLTHPAFISNHSIGLQEYNFFKALKFELSTADRVDLMVSFVRWSGLQLLWRSFLDLSRRNVPIRVLTTNYMNITEPLALRKLRELPNVDLRLFHTEHESFHTKAYLFERESGLDTVIIGSSNLSRSALQSGYEWNVKLPNATHISVYRKAMVHFNDIWSNPCAHPVTSEIIDWYEVQYKAARKSQTEAKYHRTPSLEEVLPMSADTKALVTATHVADGTLSYGTTNVVEPNQMQLEALEALEQTRVNGYTKAVVIAATGTGKTYLSALDAKAFKANSVLFIAHRDELLENAKETFSRVFGTPDLCGKLTGLKRQWDKPFLFSTVQTLHKENVLTKFPAERFEYIVVDEFHHAQANTYRSVIEYFKPKFLLGLTATPERMDGRDVLELCEHNLVYEIRLRDALENELLAPFHYFGLSDPTVNYEDIEQRNGQFVEQALVRALGTHKRVEYVIDMMEKFGHAGNRRVALAFCATIDHAEFMAQAFNRHGYRAVVLTGRNSPEERQEVIAKLESENDKLEFIFTVDVFNEGIDIPSVNLLLFLRPTESATIFLQQLGRGLRKTSDKEFVTVLDFIGNYQKSFVVPLALSGQFNHRAFDKDSLRIAVETEFADLPDGCAVDLEPVSREQILKKIEEVRLDRNQVLADLYGEFKSILGRAPEIEDFLYTENAPSLFFFISKYKSWVETKKRMGDLNEQDGNLLQSERAVHLLRRLEKMLPLKWPYDFAVLQECVQNGGTKATVDAVFRRLSRRFGNVVSLERHKSFIERAMQKLATSLPGQKTSLGTYGDGQFLIGQEIDAVWSRFPAYFNQRLEYGLTEFRRTYVPANFFGNPDSLMLYQNYTRNDLIFLFQADVPDGSWREGISKVRNHYLLFINLKKDDRVEDHLRYHDHFIDSQQFHWQSANQTSHASERGKDYVLHRERDMHIHLFVRKFESMHGVTLPFTYLGEVDYVRSHGDKPMNIVWRLHHQVPYDLFIDFIR